MCVCICLLPRNLLHTSFIRRKQGVIEFFMMFQAFCHMAFTENALFKSSGIISGHCHLPCSPVTSRWTKETVITSFQCKECVCLAIAPIIRPTQHSSELTDCQASWLSVICIVTADLALVAHARGTARSTYCAITCNVHSCGY